LPTVNPFGRYLWPVAVGHREFLGEGSLAVATVINMNLLLVSAFFGCEFEFQRTKCDYTGPPALLGPKRVKSFAVRRKYGLLEVQYFVCSPFFIEKLYMYYVNFRNLEYVGANLPCFNVKDMIYISLFKIWRNIILKELF